MKKTIYIALAVIALASCAKSEPVSLADGNELKFNVSFPSIGTKATATAFESGDAISVYAVERASDGSQLPLQVGGNWLNNEKVTFDAGSGLRQGRSIGTNNLAISTASIRTSRTSLP